ncbi:hypothetical protein HYV21_01410 [Candidatus Microgenomates bacterium]|nr:hypothetical protein [Candidatus Microgenomates bacterium]
MRSGKERLFKFPNEIVEIKLRQKAETIAARNKRYVIGLGIGLSVIAVGQLFSAEEIKTFGLIGTMGMLTLILKGFNDIESFAKEAQRWGIEVESRFTRLRFK